ncbi:MAG: gamma carbonic anhydrase family protein [Ignavibacteria bacterium]|nr:gamma carbonic anhydrase family protein [Ignavibacteria bacterium]
MILPFKGVIPRLGEGVFVASNAVVIGDTWIGDGSSVWFSAVIRGDVNIIRIGEGTNVQDGCVLHVSNGTFSLNIGNGVTIGHNAVVHGCRVADNVLIGMGAVLLDDCRIESNSVVAAGALIRQGFTVPSGVMAAGVPAKTIRDLSEAELEGIKQSAAHYTELAGIYSREGNNDLQIRI